MKKQLNCSFNFYSLNQLLCKMQVFIKSHCERQNMLDSIAGRQVGKISDLRNIIFDYIQELEDHDLEQKQKTAKLYHQLMYSYRLQTSWVFDMVRDQLICGQTPTYDSTSTMQCFVEACTVAKHRINKNFGKEWCSRPKWMRRKQSNTILAAKNKLKNHNLPKPPN